LGDVSVLVDDPADNVASSVEAHRPDIDRFTPSSTMNRPRLEPSSTAADHSLPASAEVSDIRVRQSRAAASGTAGSRVLATCPIMPGQR
jgi:hypothetical protein